MKKITSVSNPRIKEASRILRGKEKERWIVEGITLFQEALESGVRFEEVFVTEQLLQNEKKMLASLEDTGVEVVIVSTAILNRLSDVENPQGILGIARRTPAPVRQKPVQFAGFLLSIRDPGNFGAIIRSAEASGCEFLAHSADCADPLQPKVIRASMGSIFRVPLHKIAQTSNYLEEMRHNQVNVYALHPRNGIPLDSLRPEFPALLIVGSESRGLPEDLQVTKRISIPMSGKVESLNAAVAAALCFYRFNHFVLQSIL